MPVRIPPWACFFAMTYGRGPVYPGRSVQPTVSVHVKGRPVPEGANCPECASYDIGVVAWPADLLEDLVLEFECHACGHAFRLEGELADIAFAMLQARARGEVNPWKSPSQ